MCGRYKICKPVSKTVDLVKTNIKVEDSDNYNAHPSQKLPIIKSYTNGKALELHEWGLVPGWSKKIVGNWGYPVAGAMRGRKAIMSMSYGGNWFSIQTWFQNIPFRRIKAGVLKLGGMKTIYDRHYEVLPGMSKEKFTKHMERVRKLVKKL